MTGAAALAARLADAAAATADRRPPKPPPSTVTAVAGPTGHVWCAKPATVDEDGLLADECSLPAWHRGRCLLGVRSEPFCQCGPCHVALYGAASLDDVDLGYFQAAP